MVKNSEDRHRLDYQYFVFHSGSISRLRDYGLKHLYATHPEFRKEMKKFARHRHLDFYKMSDKIQLIRRLNQLINQRDTFSQKQ
ncbi:hypothetical protein WJR50_33320 [Catalinimonas sp. 4WD22]|uniref:hypothetical protein n=1 Tax=Catalinimonas locisalis TaxID=3133978 RepID=UPI003100B67B